MSLIVRLIGALILIFPSNAIATPLISDLSNSRIEIDSGFSGTRIFLIGVRNDNGDVVVVVRGPEKSFTVREKERVMGMWVHRRHMTFSGVPDFYAVAASKPLDEIKNPNLRKQLGIGLDTIITPPTEPYNVATYNRFAQAILRNQQSRRLYSKEVGNIQFVSESLFKPVIEFPDTIPPGNYTAEIYLFSDGELVASNSMPIFVVKSGIDAFVADSAHHHPFLYGITAIAIALIAGWGAGRLFDRA